MYRAAEHLFSAAAALRKHGWRFRLSLQVAAVESERVQDLLVSSSSASSAQHPKYHHHDALFRSGSSALMAVSKRAPSTWTLMTPPPIPIIRLRLPA